MTDLITADLIIIALLVAGLLAHHFWQRRREWQRRMEERGRRDYGR